MPETRAGCLLLLPALCVAGKEAGLYLLPGPKQKAAAAAAGQDGR